MYWLITEKFPDKKVEVVYTGDPEDGRYASFANFEKIKFVPDLTEVLFEFEGLIMLDGGEWGRFTNKSEVARTYAGKTICIDHHGSVPDKFDLMQVEPSTASCSELVYRLVPDKEALNVELARIFLLGILGDTGNFSYLDPSQIEALEIGKKLILKVGKSVQEFTSAYAAIPKSRFDILKELMKNTQYIDDVSGWPPFQISTLDREYVSGHQYADSEISEASHIYMDNFLRWIKGYEWGIMITPRADGTYSLSLRSLPGSVNVRRVVERMGVGGGHDRAAGATIRSNSDGIPVKLDQAKDALISWLNNNVREE
jgi:nanoRNase/pAp phosphatase (c-di-AMP/oligoRNAs hydrolase)